MGSFTPSPAGSYEQHLADLIQLSAVHPVLSPGNLNSCSMFAQKTEDFLPQGACCQEKPAER